MTPKRLAQKSCGNWNNGICLGVQIHPDGSTTIDPNLYGTPCCVNEKRCSYFEGIIIPQVILHTHKSNPQLQSMKEAVSKYETITEGKLNLKRCKQCHKPAPRMKANEKFCSDCKKARKRKQDREAKRRSRCQKSEAVS